MSKEQAYRVSQPAELLPFLLGLPLHLSRHDAKNLLRFKAVAIAGVPAPRHDTPLAPGMLVRVSFGKHTPSGTVLESGIEIVFEDEALLVINKPAGLLTIATESEKTRTAYAQVTAWVRDRSPRGDARVFVVHRLDRDTSGLLIFARTEEAKNTLRQNWKAVTKTYEAVVHGVPSPASGTFRSALVESDSLRVHTAHPEREDAKPSVTHYRVLRAGAGVSMVELTLGTGRKNQIRVQLADAGHAILGDEKYGRNDDPISRLALHASELRFHHPLNGEPLHFRSALPEKVRQAFHSERPLRPETSAPRDGEKQLKRPPRAPTLRAPFKKES